MLAVGALCLVQFVDVLGVAIVTIALPAILAGLDAPASTTPVLVTGYAMFFGGLLLLGARLGDRYGHRRVLLVGLAAFGAASALAGLAQHVLVVIVARCRRAVRLRFLPAALRLLTAVTPEGSARNRALATWSGAGAAAGATGLLLGGVLTDLAGWRSVFWINVPLAAVLIVAVWRTAPSTERESSGPLDGLGAGLLTAAVRAWCSAAHFSRIPSDAFSASCSSPPVSCSRWRFEPLNAKRRSPSSRVLRSTIGSCASAPAWPSPTPPRPARLSRC